LTIFAILGVSQQAKAYNLEACANDPMTNIETINLLQPIDQKMINCIPNINSISSQWITKANEIQSAISRIRIGNQSENDIEKLEYNTAGNTIYLVVKIRVKHTWKKTIPAVIANVPITKFHLINVSFPDVRLEKKCVGSGILKTCANVPISFINHRTENVPYVEMQSRTITPARVVSATESATCKYDYTLNLSTGEQNPIVNCGQGSLGNVSINLSAITSILSGQMPTVGDLLKTVDLTPPLFRDASRDTYNDVKNGIIASHSDSIVYFSSKYFVNWASVETQGPNVITSVLTGGSYSAELIQQIEQILQTELLFMGNFASQTAIQLTPKQIVFMMKNKTTMRIKGFNVSVKVVNTPKITQKCMIRPRNDCLPKIKEPRLGFAIVATRVH
jgi:hypothetical protein